MRIEDSPEELSVEPHVAQRLTGSDDRSADQIAVSPEVLRCRMDHEIETKSNGTLIDRGAKGAVDRAWNSVSARDLGHRPNVHDRERRVGRGFGVDQPGHRTYRGLETLQVRRLHEGDRDPPARKHPLQELERAPVQLARRDDVVPVAQL